nr:MAG: putative capsid protein [Picobirnavirus sp.]
MNDLSWYAKNPELLASAARIPFPYKPGMLLNFGKLDSQSQDDFTYRIPGVMALKYAYSIGHSADSNSAACIAAREMYGRIRANFSGSLDADAPDIMMYALALDSIHSYIAYLKRIYRTMNLYTAMNYNYPVTVLNAMGISIAMIDDIQEEAPQLWGYINLLTNMVNKWSVPKDMALYDRHRWMNENIYLDAPKPDAQSYMYVPTGFYKVGTDSAGATKLTWTPFAPIDWNSKELYDFGLSLISALTEWDDSYTINGYILRAFPESEFYRGELIAQGEVQMPLYSEEVLSQIENFVGVGSVSNMDITQNPSTNVILHQPKGTTPKLNMTYLPMNLHSASPTAAEVTIASRMMAWVDKDDLYVHGASEIPIEASVYTSDAGGDFEYYYFNEYDANETSLSTFGIALGGVFHVRAFHCAPMSWVIVRSTGSTILNYLIADVDNMTMMDSRQLDEIHRVCLYSLFNCFTR